MRTIILILIVSTGFLKISLAQNIITITNGENNYQVLDISGNEKIQWGGNDQIGIAAQSESNGKLNTKAITIAVGDNNGFDGKPYAAKVCDDIEAGGFDDWYLPAKDEAALIYLHIAKLNLEGTSTTLWTSTEANGTQAVSLYCYNGIWYNVQKVDSYNMVCMRKIE